MKRCHVMGLMVALGLQVVVMAGVFLGGVYPLWVGEEIRLETRPVDPRDLFRGNYARPGYDFSTLKASDLRPGDVVYLPLEKQPNEALWRGGEPQATEPETGLYLRGRVAGQPWSAGNTVKYGIEALFAPKEKALALERQLRHSAVAVVRVAPNGKAALVTVEAKAINN